MTKTLPLYVFAAAVGIAGGYYFSYGYLIFLLLVGGGVVPRVTDLSPAGIVVLLGGAALGWAFGVTMHGGYTKDVFPVVVTSLIFTLVLSGVLAILMRRRKSQLPVQATKVK